MKKHTLALAMAATLGYHGTILAAPTVEASGILEVEAHSGEESSDIAVASAEVGFVAQINNKVTGEVVLLHEAGEPDPIVVDIATITLSFTENFRVTTGKSYAPFGLFDSYMIADPLTLELAETSATLMQADFTTANITSSLYTFNGPNASDEQIDNWGLAVGYAGESITLLLGYLDNLGDSDTIAAETLDSNVPGVSASVGINLGAFSLIGEYIAANDTFQPGDGNADYSFSEESQPNATNVELAYSMGATTFAVGLQRSNEAETLGLPEERRIVTIVNEFMPATTIALEYASEEDYAGEESAMVTAQLAVKF